MDSRVKNSDWEREKICKVTLAFFGDFGSGEGKVSIVCVKPTNSFATLEPLHGDLNRECNIRKYKNFFVSWLLKRMPILASGEAARVNSRELDSPFPPTHTHTRTNSSRGVHVLCSTRVRQKALARNSASYAGYTVTLVDLDLLWLCNQLRVNFPAK